MFRSHFRVSKVSSSMRGAEVVGCHGTSLLLTTTEHGAIGSHRRHRVVTLSKQLSKNWSFFQLSLLLFHLLMALLSDPVWICGHGRRNCST